MGEQIAVWLRPGDGARAVLEQGHQRHVGLLRYERRNGTTRKLQRVEAIEPRLLYETARVIARDDGFDEEV